MAGLSPRAVWVALVAAGAACTVPNPDFRADGAAAPLVDLPQQVVNEAGCAPRCTGRQCGPDGCGGTCGSCPSGQSCDTKSWQCVGTCKPACQSRACGPDGCGGNCGECSPGFTCDSAQKCVPGCKPQCDGKECGPDGCSGQCGPCPPNAVCSASGQCVSGSSCGPITSKGCCAGTTLKYCQSNQLKTQDCSKHPQCGWSYSQGYYACWTSGQPDPSGKYPKACP